MGPLVRWQEVAFNDSFALTVPNQILRQIPTECIRIANAQTNTCVWFTLHGTGTENGNLGHLLPDIMQGPGQLDSFPIFVFLVCFEFPKILKFDLLYVFFSWIESTFFKKESHRINTYGNQCHVCVRFLRNLQYFLIKSFVKLNPIYLSWFTLLFRLEITSFLKHLKIFLSLYHVKVFKLLALYFLLYVLLFCFNWLD